MSVTAARAAAMALSCVAQRRARACGQRRARQR
jgi:hypothetical protein